MRLATEALDLTLANPFRISRGTQLTAPNVVVRVTADGATGIGEAAPSAYYGQTRETTLAALAVYADALGEDANANPSHIEDILARLESRLHGNSAARAAIDMALYDLLGKRLGAPLYTLLGLDPARAPRTSFTIAIAALDEMAARAAEAARTYPILKVKLGTGNLADDLAIVQAIRTATDATLRVDANAAWTPSEAVRMVTALDPYGIEFVEQPVAADDLAGLRFVRERSPLPIIADESCIVPHDVPRVVGCVDGINIKLAKCGGISAALKMIATARAHHLKVMLGCMIESSLSITAAAQISPLVDYADLDGALLTSDDPFVGVGVRDGWLVLPDGPGLGVRRRADDAAADGQHGKRAQVKPHATRAGETTR